MEPIRSHDGLFKFVFGAPENMADLLRAVLPGPVAEAIDWASLQRLAGSFVDASLQGRHTDLLFTVNLDDAPGLVYVLAEHKSDEVARWLEPLQLHHEFLLFDLACLDEAGIEALRVSAVTGLTLRFLLQFLRGCPHADAAAHIARWQHLIASLLGHPRGRDILLALFSWFMAGTPANTETLRTVMTKIHEENPPMRSMLDLLLEMGEERGIEKGMEKGIERGIERGRQEGGRLAAHDMLESLLRARFGELPPHQMERLAASEMATLRHWGVRVLTATSLDDVFTAG